MKNSRTALWLILAITYGFCLSTAAWASTVAIVSGRATTDGRPLLLKLRDNSENADQEFIYDTTGAYAFISVTYSDTLNQAWGGVNDAGFAIINSNAWNFPDTVAGPDDDGFIIREALRTCRTVSDFIPIMDSTNLTGRTRCANYGIIDASGNGAFFEAAANEYFIYDLNDSTLAPRGYMVRANYGYSGSSYYLGKHRHDRVTALLDSALDNGGLNYQYITQYIGRDLVNEETNPYPLPLHGLDGALPYGLLHTHDSINRDITRSGMVIQGILPTEDPLLCTLWALVGEPITIPALPLWVGAASVPLEFNGPSGSTLNLRSQAFHSYLYQEQYSDDAVDTWLFVNDADNGLLPLLLAVENQAFSRGDSALAIWRHSGLPAAGVVAGVQNSIALQAHNQLAAWGPPKAPAVTLVRLPGNQVRLEWPLITQDVFNRPITVSGYTVYVSDHPFLDRLLGDSLTTISAPPLTLPAEPNPRFFQVRSRL
jgi:hypothetical protein